MQENKRGAREAKGGKTTGRPWRVSLRIAMTLPAALHLDAKRKASSLSISRSGNDPIKDVIHPHDAGSGRRRAHRAKCAPPHGMTLFMMLADHPC